MLFERSCLLLAFACLMNGLYQMKTTFRVENLYIQEEFPILLLQMFSLLLLKMNKLID